MTFWKWSRTAANNATADPTCLFPEGMSPSAVNDGTRGMMAAAAKYRDDIAGAIVTTGSSTAYNISSYQGFDTLAHLDGQQIAFVPHVTNTAGSPSVTLSVDGLTAKPLRSAPGIEIPTGTLIQGTPYTFTYRDADGAFYLHGFYGNPYNVPIGCMMPYIVGTPPNSAFVFPYGQWLSRTVYSALFAAIGTAYGVGDGTSTFTIPDLRGRVVAGLDNMGGTSLNMLTAATMSPDAATIGAKGGSETITLNVSQMPAHVHQNTLTDYGHAHGGGQASSQIGFGGTNNAIQQSWSGPPTNTYGTTSNIAITNGSAGGGNWHSNVQPTIIFPYLLRVI